MDTLTHRNKYTNVIIYTVVKLLLLPKAIFPNVYLIIPIRNSLNFLTKRNLTPLVSHFITKAIDNDWHLANDVLPSNGFDSNKKLNNIVTHTENEMRCIQWRTIKHVAFATNSDFCQGVSFHSVCVGIFDSSHFNLHKDV